MTQVAAIPLDTSDEMFPKIVAILEDFLEGFDTEFDGEITRQTKVLADLGFESIDIIQLVVAIEEEIGKRDVPFEKLLMNNGSYVEDLEVGQIVDFVSH
ncbi:phosphopantetheine-binding protein [Abyssibacter sp.]|uniref:phosphopantetheine-binding protein n=1 Tax=Abyssibacter sp. TaxID=2320200 RepID=UPI0025BBEE38|nr:phosphopantetheine-binding protein [Abyssibacter sp.]MCK5857912.1 hypothetical protein [Abyssibacter sp.]